VAGGETKKVDALVAAARERIVRVDPEEAWAAASAGETLLVDLRSGDERRRDGIPPRSIHVPRSVLEWRADPASEWRNPYLGGSDVQLLLLCAEGYSSSLAAASLVELGRPRSGDVIGGFAAWRRAGLPVVEAREDVDGALPGMGGPEGASLSVTAQADNID
jgi:rhodanese-related sulfurtransferase